MCFVSLSLTLNGEYSCSKQFADSSQKVDLLKNEMQIQILEQANKLSDWPVTSSRLSCIWEWWGCSSVGRASDQHAADAALIPGCGNGFFS